MADLETLEGTIEDIRHMGTDFFGFGRLRGGAKIVGKLIGVGCGDRVQLKGAWQTHQKYGKQFRVVELQTLEPDDNEGAVGWLAGRFPSLGERRAKDVVERFGVPGVWDVLENSPQRFAEINGITAERAEEIGRTYQRIKGERERMVVLKGWGLTDAQCGALVGALGLAVVETLKRDPYCVTDLVRGFGWKKADGLAMRMGLGRDSEARRAACVRHFVKEGRGHGHCYVGRKALGRLVRQELGEFAGNVDHVITKLVADGKLEVDGGDASRVWEVALHEAEVRAAGHVARLLKGNQEHGAERDDPDVRTVGHDHQDTG